MNIKEWRIKSGLTQSQAVELLKPQMPELTRPLYSLLERGVFDVNIELPCIHGVIDTESVSDNTDDKSIVSVSKPLRTAATGSTLIDCLCNADRPLTKEELSRHLGMSDRAIRKEVERLRKNGVRIMSSSQSAGYWLCRNEAEYMELRNEYMSRIKSISKTVKAMDGNMIGQVTINEIM